MVFLYGGILALLHRRWTLASILYSAAISIKMNVLLFFPGLGLVLWQSIGAWATLGQLLLIVGLQILVATPFISAGFTMHYLSKAFEFSRVFDYQWTVNWRMVDEKTFISDSWAQMLLVGHIAVLLIFIMRIWCKE